MSKFGIGQGVPRWEDPRLLRGGGEYTDDINRPGQAHGYVVRSPHAHARILSVDTGEARSMPGVLAVYTGADIEAAGLGSSPSLEERHRPDGSPMFTPPNRALRTGLVQFVGDYVAFVVAESHPAARDAAERVEVAYEPLPAVTATAEALKPEAPTVWTECPDNLCFVHETGDKSAVDAAFARAHHVTRLDFTISRVAVAPMEPRACVGEYDGFRERYTLYTGSQGAHGLRRTIAGSILHIPENKLRVVSRDMGGAFGMRAGPYCEHILCLLAAKRIGRPVKWNGDRSEAFLSDDQARDNVSNAMLALDADGRFLALRLSAIANLGAYLTIFGVYSPVGNLGSLAGPYTTPAIHAQVSGVFTNTPPTGPYRGAGRPEAAYAIERIIDTAAAEMGIDPAEMRRRNYIPESALPYRTGFLFTYDSGAFEQNMDRVLELIDYRGFEQRRSRSVRAAKLRGIGIANVVAQSAGGPPEWAQVRFDPSGGVTLTIGTHSHGQGHETVFLQILAERLGIEPARIHYEQGDSDQSMAGTGTFGSRSSGTGGISVLLAADKIIAKCRRMAAHELETAEGDLELVDGVFRVAGTDRAIALVDCAVAAQDYSVAPADLEVGMSEWAAWRPPAPTFPNGCHGCEVEIDPETGTLELVRYVAVDDFGTVLNPLLAEGQLHGGIVQGIGQVLMESVVWDRASGQLLCGSFMDYPLARADQLPRFELESNPIPTPVNPLGVKGVGEVGCVGALPAVMNAIVNALRPLGLITFDMPATPARVWHAIHTAPKHATRK